MLAAALLLACTPILRRWAAEAIAIATAVAVTVLCAALLAQTRPGTLVYWFGGWRPSGGVALGIALAIEPLGAGLATLAGALGTAALIFSVRYFKAIGTFYHTLMLVFLAAMVGFCLSGDLFNLFVFFELMSVAAYALTAYKVEEPSPLQGALNFAVTNSLGAVLILFAIGLLYGRTGALNLAQVGVSLAQQPADGLVAMALAGLLGGLLIKAAIVPFHFWLADAHAVAPTPVCVLFSGVMVELGLFGAARVFWTVFAPSLAGAGPALRPVLVGAGVLTAIFGSCLCFSQRHLKRLLAFSTISHAGLMLIGFGLLSPDGLAGAALYTLSHGLVKAALFICTGILLHELGSVDELELAGRGRRLVATGLVFTIAGLGLAGLPPFGTYLGKSLIEEAARKQGYPWMPVIVIAVSALTGGAVLRAAGRIFAGWGASAGAEASGPTEPEARETGGGQAHVPAVMLVPAVALTLAALLVGLVPHLPAYLGATAENFQDYQGYAAAVLNGEPVPLPPLKAVEASASGLIFGLIGAVSAVGLAWAALIAKRFPASLRQAARRLVLPPLNWLQDLHSGRIGDYVTWLMVGMAAMAWLLVRAVP